jgi:hypothetical protein
MPDPQRKAVAQNQFDFSGEQVRRGQVIEGRPEYIRGLIESGLAVKASVMHKGMVKEGEFLLHHKGGGHYDVLDGEGAVLNDEKLRGREQANEFIESMAG